jgi:hypothetical protein
MTRSTGTVFLVTRVLDNMRYIGKLPHPVSLNSLATALAFDRMGGGWTAATSDTLYIDIPTSVSNPVLTDPLVVWALRAPTSTNALGDNRKRGQPLLGATVSPKRSVAHRGGARHDHFCNL